MITTLVVDGYNAINAIPHIREKLKRGLRPAREAMLALAKEYARSSGHITDVRVVFDGDDQYRHLDAIAGFRRKDQVFSNSGEGDDTIIETVRRCAKHGKVVIASNDNYVRNNSRACGASVISSEELVKTKRKKLAPAQDSEKEINARLKADITREYREHLGL